MCGVGGADNRRGNAWTRNQPGKRHGGRRGIVGCGHPVQRVQDAKAPAGQVFLDAPAPGTLGKVMLGAVLSAQEPAGE